MVCERNSSGTRGLALHRLLDDRLTSADRNASAPTNPMKAIVHCEYGSPDVLKLEDVEKPIPNDNQVLVKVRAASVNPLDLTITRSVAVASDLRTAQTKGHASRCRLRRNR